MNFEIKSTFKIIVNVGNELRRWIANGYSHRLFLNRILPHIKRTSKEVSGYWLLLLNVSPIVILIGMYIGNDFLPALFLSSPDKQVWIKGGLCMVALWSGQTAYSVIRIIQNRRINFNILVATFISYLPILLAFYTQSEELVPFSIPISLQTSNILLLWKLCP